MPNKNVEIISDTNYSITGRARPVKKKRTVFGTILALVISLLMALFLRYYVEVSMFGPADVPADLLKSAVTDTVDTV